jgi:hypothetical protein
MGKLTQEAEDASVFEMFSAFSAFERKAERLQPMAEP